ncbi:DeoR/GlpR family transcriptional regulator of sugar metabolism [Mesorhizobium robiniae]|uniref:DeoR/GlpR family transcriptional regulator of sugar metabolism n=1 Tax=Mesorhizobium robiniae TaxID=559315 RepID=A0ABV2GXY8_9HYPH|nr:DeoR/GlpR family DNA-binding transcription regulator [Mesorhizobium sp. ZC-5]MCV3243429.1 DeoR/GlpR family DNA-binding transcription regulator [Mesorhizobium sp. ZC-5]
MDTQTKRVELLPAKRRALILEHLRVNGAASIQELADTIGGSQSTVRRDLEHLVDRGYLERTHGGAHLIQPARATFEREEQVNAELRHAEKVAIGREAARRLSPGDSVILDGSSTVMEAARAAAEREIPLTIVTNSLDIAQFCAGVRQWRVIVAGGSIRPGFRNLAGHPGEEFIRTLHADICLTGASAVTGTLLTDSSLEVASMKRAMISAARKTILLVDSSKFTVPGFCTLCDVAELQEVITDDGIQPDALASLKMSETPVSIVPNSRS